MLGRKDLRALASFSLTPASSESGFPQIESSQEGFLIIPGQAFKARAISRRSSTDDGDHPIQINAVPSGNDKNQASTVNADTNTSKDKDKDTGKDKHDDKDKETCKDKDKVNDKEKSKDKDKDKDKDKCNPANQAPIVNAWPAQTITLPAVATLPGTAIDDGRRLGSTLTVNWAKVSGPGTVTFEDANALSTTAGFSPPGTYVLRLTATDSALTSSAEVTIVVNPPAVVGIGDSANHPPPTSGPFAYSSFRPGRPNFIGLGQSYVDPVFGTTIRRITNSFPRLPESPIYSKNGWWNADGTRFTHKIHDQLVAIDSTTGAVVVNLPNGDLTDDDSFDPVDPNIWYYFSGSSIRQFNILTRSDTLVKRFPATLQSPGDRVDWMDSTGSIWVVLYGGAAHVWNKQTDTLYSGSVDTSVVQLAHGC